ncbi:MAG: hypothetical protein HN641_12400 [Candidatus Marinimicrobia bacterium]|jgi:hypothetical protein|nr:hypothetical protein [Candidatus Neomarinimicrobiota bacterium]MBT4173927.1 hypothetical protein [Candidatus Neomarinimicrobiota bacterium]MBT7884624.1 hypothetical protein [Candidatus Neomarinimicrobiota bacterium]
MATRFEFIFTTPHIGDTPFTLYAKNCVKSYPSDDEGNNLISPDLFFGEYKKYIDHIIWELHEIKVKLGKKIK